MHGYYGLGPVFSEATLLDAYFIEARKALLQPGIRVENTGSQLSQYCSPIACLRVTFADETSQDVLIGSHYIPQILQDAEFPQGFSEVRTTLLLAQNKAAQFAAAEHERKERECAENTERLKNQIKSVVKRFLPF